MKTIALSILIALCVVQGANVPLRAEDNHVVRVVVPPFENLSGKVAAGNSEGSQGRGKFRLDRFVHDPRETLEDVISNVDGVRVVERSRIDEALMEIGGYKLQSFLDREKVRRVAVNFDAGTVVFGTLIDVARKSATYTGYGVTLRYVVWTATLRVRIDTLASGKMDQRYSRILRGEVVQEELPNLKIEEDNDEVVLRAVDEALAVLKDDAAFRSALRAEPVQEGASRDRELTQIFIDAKPDGADVWINEHWVGLTPCTARVPSGKEATIRIEKEPEYRPWEARIVPERGMKINRDLRRVPEVGPAEEGAGGGRATRPSTRQNEGEQR